MLFKAKNLQSGFNINRLLFKTSIPERGRGRYKKNPNKFLLAMKMTVALIFLACLSVSGKPVEGQTVSLSVTNAKLETVFKEIKKQTGYVFFYDRQILADARPVSLHVKGQSVAEVLKESMRGQSLSFSITRETVTIFRTVGYPATSLAAAVIENNALTLTEAPRAVITGTVKDAQGKPLAGVSVVVKGTRRGTSTNSEGRFSIEADPGQTLEFTFVGYTAIEREIGRANTINVVLQQESGGLNEVVVTALGITRERKTLGYSVSEVNGDELTQAKEVNVMNSLVGKVAGLNVNSIAGGPGASANVIIRGISSLGGTNQPLYVVDGVPMESSPNGVGTGQFSSGPDYGDAIGNLNPNDIESITVLKGAAASALYGYRAKGGVILITTKTADANDVEVNSNYVFQKIIDFTDFQYVYGQGMNGLKPTDAASAYVSGQRSWGAKLDGSNAFQADGIARPYVAHSDNLSKFYRTGGTFTNNIALNRKFEKGNIRFSATNLNDKSVMPNSKLDRQNFDFSGAFSPVKRLVFQARANYILQQDKNPAILGDTPGNANYGVVIIANSVDIDIFKPMVHPDGSELGTSSNTFATNPYFAAYKISRTANRERLMSSLTARYDLDHGVFFQARVGRDSYYDRFSSISPNGRASAPLGSISESSTRFQDLNVDGLAGATIKIKNALSLTPNVGASYRRTKTESISNSGTEFAIPFIYNILNVKQKTNDYGVSDLEVQSVYGTLEADFKSFLFINGSVRSDWFSSLATPGIDKKLNVVYPSVSSSFIFSQFLKTSWLNFGKLRAGYAVVGQATVPYQTQLSYSLLSTPLNGRQLGNIVNTNIPNQLLKPSKATELEIGTELHMFSDRISLDVTWYKKKSVDEIIFAPASITSGYSNATLNVGALQNTGVEALINYRVVNSNDFRWTTSINGAINNNKVIKLVQGLSQLPGATSRSGVGFTASLVGYAAAQIMAYDNKYDSDGKVVLDANGVPARGALVPWGSAYSRWVAGWNNEFSYKRFNFSFLIDGKFGGKIFASMNYNANRYGLLKATLVDREKFGTPDRPMDAMTYYTTLGANVSKQFVQDASFIKFRQFIVGYNFPVNMFNNKIKGLNISFVGRNLFYLMRHTENIDPEASYSSTAGGLSYGLENGGLPPTRSYGINLNFKF